MAEILRIEGINKKLAWALRYAASGFPVFPVHYPIGGDCSCGNRGECAENIRGRAKHPMANLAPRGKTDAVTDAETIKRWWRIEPNANFGAVPPRNCSILDVDGALGLKTFTELSEKYGEPLGPIVRTARGFHVYCQFRADLANTAGVWPGIDVRNFNGYVLGIGSQHISEQYYEEDATSSFDTPFGACTWPYEKRDARADAGVAGDGERRIEEGHRDSGLLSIGGHLHNLGMSNDMLFKALTLCDEAWCKPPLGAFSVAKIAKSVSKYAIHPPQILPVKLEINGDGEIGNEWVLRLIRDSKGQLKKLPSNIDLIIRHDPETVGRLQLDVFSQRINCIGEAPFARTDGCWGSNDTTKLSSWLSAKYKVASTLGEIDKFVHAIAADNPFHPVKNYLDSLVWDGTERLGHFLDDVFGAGDSEYHQKIGAGFFVGAVTRIFNPGAQVDSMLILDGAGGYGKSQSLAALVPERSWYVDMTLEFGGQEFTRMLFGKWIVDMSEGTSMKKSDADRIKATITKMVDTDRPLYSSHTVDYPRQCVFVSTANDFEISDDFAMKRRMWLVECKMANPEFVRLNRDQLWAEAVVKYQSGVKYWDVSRELIEKAHENRVVHDSWEEDITEWVVGRVTVTVKSIEIDCLGLEPNQRNSLTQFRVRKCLKAMGWATDVIKESGKSKRAWRKK